MQRRQLWSEEEERLCQEAIKLYGQDWKQIEAHMGGTKSVLQIRKYVQIYNQRNMEPQSTQQSDVTFLGTKRKTDYHQQDSAKQARSSEQKVPWTHREPILFSPVAFSQWLVAKNFGSSIQFPLPHEVHTNQQMHLYRAKLFIRRAIEVLSQRPPPDHGPNFHTLYSFLYCLLDNDPSYLNKLHAMSAIDRETLQLLMHNLFINLASTEFREQHYEMMQQYKEHAAQTLPDNSFMPHFSPL